MLSNSETLISGKLNDMKIKFSYVPLTKELEEFNKKYYWEEKEDWKGWQAEFNGLCGVGKSKKLSFDDLMSKLKIQLEKENGL